VRRNGLERFGGIIMKVRRRLSHSSLRRNFERVNAVEERKILRHSSDQSAAGIRTLNLGNAAILIFEKKFSLRIVRHIEFADAHGLKSVPGCTGKRN
jgi:hypothetical protein